MFRFLVIVASVVAAAHAFGTGAPPSDNICRNMTPKHGVDAQTKTSPYKISISESSIHSGDKVTVTLEGLNGENFKGFLVQARLLDETIVGSFEVDPTDAQVQTIDCLGGQKNAVTHKNSNDKPKVSIIWLAPENFSGTITFKATIVKNGETFWVAQTSSKLTVGH